MRHQQHVRFDQHWSACWVSYPKLPKLSAFFSHRTRAVHRFTFTGLHLANSLYVVAQRRIRGQSSCSTLKSKSCCSVTQTDTGDSPRQRGDVSHIQILVSTMQTFCHVFVIAQENIGVHIFTHANQLTVQVLCRNTIFSSCLLWDLTELQNWTIAGRINSKETNLITKWNWPVNTHFQFGQRHKSNMSGIHL